MIKLNFIDQNGSYTTKKGDWEKGDHTTVKDIIEHQNSWWDETHIISNHLADYFRIT